MKQTTSYLVVGSNLCNLPQVDWAQTGRLLLGGSCLIVPRAGILQGLEMVGMEGGPEVQGNFFLFFLI